MPTVPVVLIGFLGTMYAFGASERDSVIPEEFPPKYTPRSGFPHGSL